MESQSKKSSALKTLSSLWNGSSSATSDPVTALDRSRTHHHRGRSTSSKAQPFRLDDSVYSDQSPKDHISLARSITRPESASESKIYAPSARSSLSLEAVVGKKVSAKFAKYLSQTDDDWGVSNIKASKSLPRMARSTTPNSSSRSLFPQNGVDTTTSRQKLHSSGRFPLPAKLAHRSVEVEVAESNALVSRIKKFSRILDAPIVDLNALRTLAWNGIPSEHRPIVWKYLLGYLPCNASRREVTLKRKRDEYNAAKDSCFNTNTEPPPLDQTIWRQIVLDVPRTNPSILLYQNPLTQRMLERILYVWASRHPASGYVQGISDLVTPFIQVFLSEYIGDKDPMTYDIALLDETNRNDIEADAYWCLSKLLDGIQDNYIHAQPGIRRQVNNLRELTLRIDEPLVKHLQMEGVDFLQFSFRWMNCLLMRELSISNIIRMWDTYMAEGVQGFSEFHLYVCAAFLVKWSSELQKMEFQDILIFLQSIPTKDWSTKDIEILLSEAFLWKSLYSGAGAHLKR